MQQRPKSTHIFTYRHTHTYMYGICHIIINPCGFQFLEKCHFFGIYIFSLFRMFAILNWDCLLDI